MISADFTIFAVSDTAPTRIIFFDLTDYGQQAYDASIPNNPTDEDEFQYKWSWAIKGPKENRVLTGRPFHNSLSSEKRFETIFNDPGEYTVTLTIEKRQLNRLNTQENNRRYGYRHRSSCRKRQTF